MKKIVKLIQNTLKLPFDIFPMPKAALYPLDDVEELNEEELEELLNGHASDVNLDSAYLIGTESAARDLLLTMSRFNYFEEMEPGYFFIGYWGYGVNSYSFYYVLVDTNSQIYFRLPLGGAYSNIDEDIAEIREFLGSFFSYYSWIKDNSLHFSAINIIGSESYKIQMKGNIFIEGNNWKKFMALLPEITRSC